MDTCGAQHQAGWQNQALRSQPAQPPGDHTTMAWPLFLVPPYHKGGGCQLLPSVQHRRNNQPWRPPRWQQSQQRLGLGSGERGTMSAGGWATPRFPPRSHTAHPPGTHSICAASAGGKAWKSVCVQSHPQQRKSPLDAALGFRMLCTQSWGTMSQFCSG